MNRIGHIRCLAAAAAALAGALLVSAAAAPTALARPGPPLSQQLKHPLLPSRHWTGPVVPAHTVISGGMPGWQIALIAAAAALAATAVAVLLWTGPEPGPRAARRSPAPRLPDVAGPRRQPTLRAIRRDAVPIHDTTSRRAA